VVSVFLFIPEIKSFTLFQTVISGGKACQIMWHTYTAQLVTCCSELYMLLRIEAVYQQFT